MGGQKIPPCVCISGAEVLGAQENGQRKKGIKDNVDLFLRVSIKLGIKNCSACSGLTRSKPGGVRKTTHFRLYHQVEV